MTFTFLIRVQDLSVGVDHGGFKVILLRQVDLSPALEELLLVLSVELALDASHLVFEMILELSCPVKFRSALITLELPFLVMAAHMVLQVALRDELLAADLARVVALAKVRLQVNIQVAFLCEAVAAKLALVGFDAEVLTQVNL